MTSAVQPAGEEAVHHTSPHVTPPAEWPAPSANFYPGRSTIIIKPDPRKRTRLDLEGDTASARKVQILTTGFSEVTVVTKMRRATVHVDEAEQHTQAEADVAV